VENKLEGVDKAMDLLQQLQRRAEQVEVVEIQAESTLVNFESNRLKGSQVEETYGTAVRVVCDGKLGFAASSDSRALNKLVSNALESAEYGESIPIHFPAAQAGPKVFTFDPLLRDLPIPRLVEMGREMVDAILKVEPSAKVMIKLERRVEHMTLDNQAGAHVAYEKTPLSIFMETDLIQGDDMLILESQTGTTAWDEHYLEITRQQVELLEQARRRAEVHTGRMPVLFTPAGALALAFPLMMGIDGKNIYTGTSPVAGKLEHKLFDSEISVVDDGTLDGRIGSASHDDEGVPHHRNVVVEQGVLKSFLYDLKTAAQSGVESTGNAGRGLFSPPYPQPTNFLILPGSTQLKEMIASIQEGVLVEQVLGLGQGNILSGAFSNPVSLGFKIEKGEIVGRVKDISIAGNIYEVLEHVAAVSRETQWVYGSFNLPYILLPEMNVVAKE
jgi:PmbA protein